ncbi:MAG: DUF3458 domain-containing protein [Lentisphaerae bacterium]|nr:DUF3458 domain-containing protein [Lentisphaerota bacterium]
MPAKNFKYKKSEYVRPSVQLSHVDLDLKIYDDRVVGRERLLLKPIKDISTVELDVQDLEIGDINLVDPEGMEIPLIWLYIKKENSLRIVLPREFKTSEEIVLEINAVCRPTDNILEGLYFDTTPPGAPPQIMSQCQQWGFQRIMPTVDDCTAKCTWKTRLEASNRYTHLISNGDVLRETNPDGVPVPLPDDPSRMAITYLNSIPMPPYLFIAAAGTWDVLADSVTTDLGREIRLEYLVPPGKIESAHIPMQITKDCVLWQSRHLSYEYERECYRTICMEKSNFGGMENAGNTTIITEAALIDDWTVDARLVYAHSVIIHEYEHNHCGGDVTMETPFDMWLNEAYTVTVERDYVREKFGFELIRLSEIDSIRAPLNGPLAMEEGGKTGRIVREGFNHPDDVVDGVTYVKAPEVLGMLRSLIGDEKYEKAISLYFTRYNGGNADTEDFLNCFRETADIDLNSFLHEWLFTAGYPELRGTYSYSPDKRRLVVAVSQLRHGRGRYFTIPFRISGVDAGGRVMESVNKLLVLDSEYSEFVFEDVPFEPEFLDWNSGEAFYGTFTDEIATRETLVKTVKFSPFIIGRVEAMRTLRDIAMKNMMDDLAPPSEFVKLFREILDDASLPDGIKASLLTISDEMLDRSFLPFTAERNAAARKLSSVVAKTCNEQLLDVFERVTVAPENEELASAIPRRSLCDVVSKLLAAAAGEREVEALVQYFEEGAAISDKLYAASAVNSTDSVIRHEIMNKLRDICKDHVAAYGGYLRVLASSPHNDVFEAITSEEKSADFRIEHPSHSRSLYGGMAVNNAQLWTTRGIDWAGETLLRLADINEYTALNVVSAFTFVLKMNEPLRSLVVDMLAELKRRVSAVRTPSLYSRISQILGN